MELQSFGVSRFNNSTADVDDLGWQRIGSRTSHYTGRFPYRPKQITETRRGPVSWLAILTFGLSTVAISVAVAAPSMRSFFQESRAELVFNRCTSALQSSLSASSAGAGELARRRVNGTFVCEALRDECERSPFGERCEASVSRL